MHRGESDHTSNHSGDFTTQKLTENFNWPIRWLFPTNEIALDEMRRDLLSVPRKSSLVRYQPPIAYL